MAMPQARVKRRPSQQRPVSSLQQLRAQGQLLQYFCREDRAAGE